MDKKRQGSWLIFALIHSAAWGILLPVVRPVVHVHHFRVVAIAGAVIAFAPIPLAFWLDARNRGELLPRSRLITIVVLVAVLIVTVAVAVTTSDN